MIAGQFSPSIFFTVSTFIIIPTLAIIYYISQVQGHQPPFPKCWISGCAGHYPQFVFFRIATISGSVLVALGWFTNHFYLKTIARQRVFRIQKYHPQVSMILGVMGAMLLMGSTANLDTGKSDGHWHTSCASSFFIFTLVALVYNTFIGWIVYKNIKTLSIVNLYFKTAIFASILFQLLLSQLYGAIGLLGENKSLGNDMDKILEWSLTVTVILNFYSIGLDTKHFKFVYDSVPTIDRQSEVELVD